MGKKKTPGLTKRKGIWHIDKVIQGRRLCESTGTSQLNEAEQYLAKRIEEVRLSALYGARPKRTFRQAATKYLMEENKRSLHFDAQHLAYLDPFIGELYLEQVHQDALAGYIKSRREKGIKSATVNRSLATVRRVLNLAARLWRDENGLSWLETAPLIRFVDWNDKRQPYPLSWEEQDLLFGFLAPHLQPMALFKVNTGTREQEVCGLKWEWEEKLPTMGISIFVIPAKVVKNKEDRVVVLNSVAESVIEEQRGKNRTWVFPHKDNRLTRIYNSSWKNAREKASKAYEKTFGQSCPDGFRNIRVHDLKHTYGRRLRAAGISVETRKALLGHKSNDITTHYSAAEVKELLEASESVAVRPTKNHALVMIKGTLRDATPAKVPQENVS